MMANQTITKYKSACHHTTKQKTQYLYITTQLA